MKKKDRPILQTTIDDNNTSLLQWTLLIAVVFFIFIFQFRVALFNAFTVGNGDAFGFEAPLLEAMIYTFALLLIAGIRLIRTWKINDFRAILSMAVLFLPVMYLMSYIGAVTVHNAKLMMLTQFMVVAFFILGLYIAENKLHRTILAKAIQLSGYGVVIYGLMNLFGQAYFPNALWKADESFRLTSIFQYSNSYAGFLTALFLGGLFLVIHCKQWYWRSLHAFMLVPIWISMMLTYSRAALLFVPLLVLIILPFLRIGKQFTYLIYMFLAIVSSFAILSNITIAADKIATALNFESEAGNTFSIWNKQPMIGWGLLIGAALVVAAIITIFHSRLLNWIDSKTEKFTANKWSFVAVPLIFVIIGSLAATLLLASSGVRSLLPASIADRIANINFEQHSVLERGTFYKDALKLSGDYPLIGAGGGAWTVLYEEYQNNPYTSRQAHSYFFQTLIEIGWIGLILLIAFLVLVYTLFIRAYIRNPELRGSQLFFFILSISILAHSAIDFDMSYSYLAIIVFLSLGAMLAPFHQKLVLPSMESIKDRKWRIAYPISLSLIALILFTWVYREYSGNLAYRHAMDLAVVQQKSLDELLPSIDDAINISPSHPDYTLRKINWMKQAFQQTGDVKFRQEIKKLIDQLKPFEPYNRYLLLEEYQFYKDEGQQDRVLQVLNDGIKKFQWDINFYEAAIMEYYLAGEKDKQNNPELTDTKWKQSLELYQEVLNRIELLKTLPETQLQGREFNVTFLMRQAIGIIHYNHKDYEAAKALLVQDIAENLQDNVYARTTVRYYLASLEATGQNDENLYNKLIEADENERASLEELYKNN
ncbi:O-antigen ligase family protein [Paenibacillus oenotherae]|uniref:O-antigen ligase family protein n=1 Tax=Paenibacillus oenotherae TaxID=1435645 RepID=A0ABS7D571_9BACL|nr:O-antigen ligase family protein [Paenibacillus oenotherae]MBW7475068.1 O-antigen ligase family protein [Paenibacillus oenotherae]